MVDKNNILTIRQVMDENEAGYDNSFNACLIYGIAKSLKEPKILELGTGYGQSTIFFALGCKEVSGKVVTVESSDLSNKVKELFVKYGVDNYVTMIHGDDSDPKVVKQVKEYVSFDIIFIDTSHGQEQTLNELRTYSPLVSERGLILLHDSEMNGVGTAIVHFLKENNGYKKMFETEYDAANICILKRVIE